MELGGPQVREWMPEERWFDFRVTNEHLNWVVVKGRSVGGCRERWVFI